jgi:hypothetical protein
MFPTMKGAPELSIDLNEMDGGKKLAPPLGCPL